MSFKAVPATLTVFLFLSGIALAENSITQQRLEAETVDIDGDGVELIDDNCPTLATPDTTDSDGDDVGDACDAYHSAQPPRQLLMEAVNQLLAADIDPPSCMGDALSSQAWSGEFHLNERDGARHWRCYRSLYRDLAPPSDDATPQELAALQLVGEGLVGLAFEEISLSASRGVDDPRLLKAGDLAQQGADLVDNQDHRAANLLLRSWRTTIAADQHDSEVVMAKEAVKTGDMKGASGEVHATNWDGCSIRITYTPDGTVNCSEISFVQADLVTDKAGTPQFLNDEERRRAAANNWSIDRLAGRQSACYGYDNGPPRAANGVTTTTGSSLGKTPATLSDGPCVVKEGTYCFQTCAICKDNGPNRGLVLACISWGCSVKGGKVTQKKTTVSDNIPQEFFDSVEAWNKAAAEAGNPNMGKDPIPPLKSLP